MLGYSSRASVAVRLPQGVNIAVALAGKQPWQYNLLQYSLDFGLDLVPCLLFQYYYEKTACGQKRQLLPKLWILALFACMFWP